MIFRLLNKRRVLASFQPYLTPQMLRELETELNKTSEWQALRWYLFPERTLRRLVADDPNARNSLVWMQNTADRILTETKAKERI